MFPPENHSMKLSSLELLARLGAGESIDSVCQQAELTPEEFQAWWRHEAVSRVPAMSGNLSGGVTAATRIERDAIGIPHIYATNDVDLFYAFGYALAQDRLFQLDYLRRRALGRLSEILGPEGLELDLVARTVGLHRIAAAEWTGLPDETRLLLTAYTRGVNAVIDACGDKLPIEFDLLGYRPDPWRPEDCLAIEGEFRWYLTGRFPVIVIPELAKRTLGDGPLYEAFLLGESDTEAILPSGSYPASRNGSQPVGKSVGDPDGAAGSNNWVVSGKLSQSGLPLLASDPHIAFGAVSCWHEVHLCGGSFNVTGMTYAGIPAVMFGRNRQVAWGCTNNICSVRDLYQERTDPAHPGCYLNDGRWEPGREVVETIAVKGQSAVQKTIRYSHNGPIVDEILSPLAQRTGPVALKWLGAFPCGWLTALLQMDRASTTTEFRDATSPWHVPTFCLVFADTQGHIGYQCTGRIPIRDVWERGYRPGWDPQHQWQGLIPFEQMPTLADPERGWIATANNRVAANDFPYPLSGTWLSGQRALRIRQMLTEPNAAAVAVPSPGFSRDDFVRMHQDALSMRAVTGLPRLLKTLAKAVESSAESYRRQVNGLRSMEDRAKRPNVKATAALVERLKEKYTPAEAERMVETKTSQSAEHESELIKTMIHELELKRAANIRVRQAFTYLAAWDCRIEPDRVGASLFNMFFTHWCKGVASQRFDEETAAFVSGAIGGLALELLAEDRFGWFFNDDNRIAAIMKAFEGALDALTKQCGDNMLNWNWGRIHTVQQKHALTARGDLAKLLDRGGLPVKGDGLTVCNTGNDPNWGASMGAGYRMIADLADEQGGLWAIDAGGESGHPGSPHYDDQLADWITAQYHYISLDAPPVCRAVLNFEP